MEAFSALLVLCEGNHPSSVNSPQRGLWRGALMFTLIYAWTNGWISNRNAGDLRSHRTRYDVTVMCQLPLYHSSRTSYRHRHIFAEYFYCSCSVFSLPVKLHVDETLQWRHNGRDSVPNHQPHDCLFNRIFRRRSKKTSKLRVTGLCAGNSPGTGEFPAQMAS